MLYSIFANPFLKFLGTGVSPLQVYLNIDRPYFFARKTT